MSSPIAHGLVAVSIFALVSSTTIPTLKIRLPTFSQLIGLTAIACLPDFDFILALITSAVKHRGITHSIIFVVAFWLATRLFHRNKSAHSRRWGFLLTLVVASHILVDLTVQDGVHPTTLQLFWPFELEFTFNQFLPLFPPINWVMWTLNWQQSLPFIELLWIGLWEAAAGAAILVLAISYLRIKFYLSNR